jgi:hypothetical protein
MKFRSVMFASLLAGGAGLAGCHSTEAALGLTKVTPDEFRVVTKAPLVIPPDYSLRPPAPGQPRPQELQPEEAARAALDQQPGGDTRDDGEKLFVARAGGDHADPLINYEVDDEFGNVSHKDKNFADWVMFWRHNQPAAPPANQLGDPNVSSPVNAANEDARLRQLTGNQPVLIAREGASKVKLPGL